MNEEKSYYYDDYDRAADAGIYDEFEGASTGKRRSSSSTGKTHKKKVRRVKKQKQSGRSGNSGKPVNKKKRRIRTAIIVLVFP